MKKKLAIFMMAGITAFMLAACGAEGAQGESTQASETQSTESAEKATEAASAENVQIANPWHDISYEEAKEIVPNLFKIPEGATNVKWSMMGEKEDATNVPGPLVQATFDLDGQSYNAREQVTGDEAADISGLYYEWNDSLDSTLMNWGGGNMKGVSYRHIGENETIDLFTWYDVEIGLSYALSTSGKDLDGFDIQGIVEMMHDETTEAGYGMPDEGHVPVDITGCDTFTQIVDKLPAGMGYTNATIGGVDVLMVASGTFDMEGDGKTFGAIDADIYQYNSDGQIEYMGYVEAGGTAYPLGIKDGILYVGRNHGMDKYTMVGGFFIPTDSAYVEYDTSGNATYYNFEGKEQSDDSLFNKFFDEYAESEILIFDTIQ